MKSYKIFIDNHGDKITRISRWITLKELYNVTPRHSLYCYANDENGERAEKTGAKENYLTCFRFDGRVYALDQFVACNGFWGPVISFEENGETNYINGYDGDGNVFKPLLIQLDDCGERVRVYEYY